jgi:hypothetical protein
MPRLAGATEALHPDTAWRNLPQVAQRWPRRVRRLLSSAARVTAPSGYLSESLAQFRPDTILLLNGLDVARYEIPGA